MLGGSVTATLATTASDDGRFGRHHLTVLRVVPRTTSTTITVTRIIITVIRTITVIRIIIMLYLVVWLLLPYELLWIVARLLLLLLTLLAVLSIWRRNVWRLLLLIFSFSNCHALTCMKISDWWRGWDTTASWMTSQSQDGRTMNAAPLTSKPHWRDAAILNTAATQLRLNVRRTAAMPLNRSSWSPSSSMGSCCKRDNHGLNTALSWSRRYPGAVLIAFKPPCSSSSTDTSFRGSPSSAHSERAGLDGHGAPRPRCSSSSESSSKS